MQTIILNVKGMSCGHCVNTVEGAVKNLGASGKVDLNANSVTVEFDASQVSLDAIKEAIEDQGYDIV